MNRTFVRYEMKRSFSMLTMSACFVWAACMFSILGLAVAEQADRPQADPRLGSDDDAFLNRQAAAFLADVTETLTTVKPSAPEVRERYLALRLLDAVLHDVYAPNRPPVQSFFHERMEQAALEIETVRVDEGAVIWKLYNHGFVVRTNSVTLAFDIHPGPEGFRITDPAGKRTIVPCPGFPVPDGVLLRIAKACDVLFISHVHADHASKSVAQAFIDQGKPVVAPDTVFKGSPIHEKITHLKREAHTLQTLSIQDGKAELRVVVYPGQQYQDGGVPNNVVLVFTPEGLSFAHNGDQINDPYPQYQEDYAWIDHVHEHHKVDVFMINCWGNDLFRDVRGFNPKLVLPGHENEMSHPVWDRVPYWGDSEYLRLTYPELKASEYPVVVMTWGESYHYRPEEK
jgi:L-ascorbate metabolism protein UlaG (beta-lactamase superfamily)